MLLRLTTAWLAFRICTFQVWHQKLSIHCVWKVFEPSHPSQAYHQSSPFKILFLLALGWVLASGHPHDDHGIVKQGMFKVYPRSSSRQLSNFHLFQQFLLQWSLEPGLNFQRNSDVCFSLTSFPMWGKKVVAAWTTSRLLPRTSWPRNLAKKLLTLDIPWEIFQRSQWEPESRHIDRKSHFHVILKIPKQHIERKSQNLLLWEAVVS